MSLSLSADQRNALYAHVQDDLLGADDLRLAIELYESERPEQEAFRARWEQTALLRDTCDELLGRLPRD